MKKYYVSFTIVVILLCIFLLLLCIKNTGKKAVTKEVTISESVVYLEPGKEYNLNYIDNSNGERKYIFESTNPNIATVDESGRVEALKSGKVMIRAIDVESNTLYDDCEIIVEGPTKKNTPVKTQTTSEEQVTISLNKSEISMDIGSSEHLIATVSPNSAKSNTISWSSDNETVATVSNSGVVNAKNGGTAIITAKTSSGSTATCKVTVIEKTVKLTSIKIIADKTVVYVGSTLELNVITYPTDATDKSITWSSSNDSVATVSNNGVVTGIKSGSVTITATSSNGKESTIKIAVLDAKDEISSIRINTNGTSLKIGDSITLVATISPSYSKDQSVTWSSSDSSVATVTNDGVVTAKKLGTAIITATSSNGKQSKCTIKVVERSVEITSLKLTKSTAEVRAGEKVELNTIITPNNATNQKITWTSSDPSVATVSYGTVTTLKAGTVTITATSNNGKTATCTITVLERLVPVTKVSLSTTFISLYIGQTEKISATVTPSDASNKTITWRSENTNIATISSDGTIKAISVGTVEISATSSNGKVAIMKVRVESGVTKITLNKTNLNMNIGTTEKLVATITPNNAPDKSITWLSSDESVATVSNGIVSAKKAGTVTITAKSVDGKVATCTVVVNNPYIDVTNIKLNTSSETIRVGETVALVATISPSNATDKSVTWISSDSNIATVSNKGVVTGKKAGVVTITAKSVNGKVATSKITVKSNSYLYLDKTSIVCEIGETSIVTTTSSSAIKSVTSSNSKIAKVSYKETNKYVVNCSSTGLTTIRFIGNDGASAVLSVYVKKKTTTYNIARDSKFEKYEQVASCYSDTMSYRIIKIDGNYYSLIWVSNANKQINNGLARRNAEGVATAEEIFEYPSKPQKCFIGVNGSFTYNGSPKSNVVISEGIVAKNKGNSSEIIGINSSGLLKYYNNASSGSLLKDGIRNTFKVSSMVSQDHSTDVALRTQFYQYDKNNFVIYSGRGTVSSGLTNVKSLTGITEGYNLEGGASRKLYYRTKTSELIKLLGGDKKIPDTLYITE